MFDYTCPAAIGFDNLDNVLVICAAVPLTTGSLSSGLAEQKDVAQSKEIVAAYVPNDALGSNAGSGSHRS